MTAFIGWEAAGCKPRADRVITALQPIARDHLFNFHQIVPLPALDPPSFRHPGDFMV